MVPNRLGKDIAKCGGLNRDGPIDSQVCMLGPERDTIRRCGLVGVGVALSEEVCHCGGGL